MLHRFAILAAAVVLAGCGTGGLFGPPAPAPDEYVQVVVRNNSARTGVMHVSARWDGLSRVELGQVEQRESLTSTIPVRGTQLSVGFSRAESSFGVAGGLSVTSGERVEFELDSRGRVLVRRLPSRLRTPAGN